MMRAPYDRAALLLQVETYDLQGVDHYKLMLVWREDQHTIHEVHLPADLVYADPRSRTPRSNHLLDGYAPACQTPFHSSNRRFP